LSIKKLGSTLPLLEKVFLPTKGIINDYRRVASSLVPREKYGHRKISSSLLVLTYTESGDWEEIWRSQLSGCYPSITEVSRKDGQEYEFEKTGR
jgi:hypothetical protein